MNPQRTNSTKKFFNPTPKNKGNSNMNMSSLSNTVLGRESPNKMLRPEQYLNKNKSINQKSRAPNELKLSKTPGIGVYNTQDRYLKGKISNLGNLKLKKSISAKNVDKKYVFPENEVENSSIDESNSSNSSEDQSDSSSSLSSAESGDSSKSVKMNSVS